MDKIRTYDSIYQELYEKYNKYINNSNYIYKSCQKDWIVILKLLPDSKTNINRTNIINPDKAKYRTNKAKVILIFNKLNLNKTCSEITNSFYIDKRIIYKVGEIVEEKKYDENINNIFSDGIHFFKSIMCAYLFELNNMDNVLKYNLFGSFETYYESGIIHIRYEYKFIDGFIQCLYEEYYDNSQLYLKCSYLNGNLHGEYILYNDNGKINEKINYHNGKKHGESLYYRKGILYEKCNYNNDELNGESIIYHSNGKIYSKINYICNSHIQKCITYDILGNLCSIKVFNLNGTVKMYKNFIQDILHGEYYNYDNKGNIIFEENYFYGNRNGECLYYYPDGKIKEQRNYENGVLHGLYKSYDITGKLLLTQMYNHGQIINLDDKLNINFVIDILLFISILLYIFYYFILN